MEKSAIIMLGSKKSDSKSPFAVFENFGDWSYLKNNKVIPEGMYFAVVVPENNKKVDIFPDLGKMPPVYTCFCINFRI